MSDEDAAQRRLLLEIARCPNAAKCLSGGAPHDACAEIVAVQNVTRLEDLQVPEPWSGRLDTARILFVSSNPALSLVDAYPTGASNDDEIVSFFADRFSTSIERGIKPLQRDGTFGDPQKFWSFVRKRAEELGVTSPGIGYALTEVVHCKSNGESGVAAARTTCADLYLGRILTSSNARTLIALGEHAEHELRRLAGVDDTETVVGPIDISGRQRMLAFIPHSNARIERTFRTLLQPDVFEGLRAWTQESEEPPGLDPT